MSETEKERQHLMQLLLDAVKQCQVNFGGKTMLATDKDSSVMCLIRQFEQALQHGLKKNKFMEKLNSLTEPLRQVTQKIIPEIDATYWSMVKEILSPMDVKHIEGLDGVTTEAGKARVWLRQAINEHTLERHLSAALANESLLKQYYEAWALMLDGEVASNLPVMARGLSSIIFALEMDGEALNKPFQVQQTQNHVKSHRRVNSNPLPVFAGFDTEPAIVKKINMMKKKKKRKVVQATINDLEEIPGETNIISSSYTSGSYMENAAKNPADDFFNEKSRSVNRELETRSAPVSPAPHMSSSDENDNATRSSVEYSSNSHLNTGYEIFDKEEHVSNEKDDVFSDLITSEQSVSSKNEIGGTKLKTNPEGRSFIDNASKEHMVSLDDKFDGSKNKTNMDECHDASNELNFCETKRLRGDHSSPVDIVTASRGRDNQDKESVTSSNSDNIGVGSESSKYIHLFMSYDQESSQAANDALALIGSGEPLFSTSPKQAIPLAVSKHLEKFVPKQVQMNTEHSNLSTVDLKQAILATAKKKDEVEEQNRALRSALEEQREHTQSLQRELERSETASKEKHEIDAKKINDLAREVEVLKNQLKKYVAAVQSLRKEVTVEGLGNLKINTADVVIPPKPKERTCSENDSIFEDKLAQMAELHGELMEFQENLQRQLASKETYIIRMRQELVSLRGPLPSDDIADQQEAVQGNQERTRPLINIWIPSVFLKGRGADSHHLYQIYIRVDDDEWNVYRRYSQFNKLHLQMCKKYNDLEKFDFPKKKMFGKKDMKFVEVRRKRLQEYLRILINTSLQNETQLSSKPNKEHLVTVLPFFSESFTHEEDKKKGKKGKERASSPVYTGFTSFPEI